MKKAIGCLEVLGYSVALDTMDQACKGADVSILGIECNNPTKGEAAVIPNVFQIKFNGDVDQVRIALSIAKNRALKYLEPEDVVTHLITGQAKGLEKVLMSSKVKLKE